MSAHPEPASRATTPSTPPTRRGFAVVDVETNGLDPLRHRVLEVAVTQVAATGTVERRWSSLIRCTGDTGPVHIHGLTRERLAAAPRFADVAGELCELLEGRILVAHNAAFDWAFLSREAARAGLRLPAHERLCTVTLARQLAIPSHNLKLSTLAGHWGIPVGDAHHADDDVRVLVDVLARCLDEAGAQGAPLPLETCHPVAGPLWTARRIAATILATLKRPSASQAAMPRRPS